MIKEAFEFLYQDSESDACAESIGRFSTQVLKFAADGQREAIPNFVKECFQNFSPKAIVEITATVEALAKYGTDLEKKAFSPMLSGLQATMATLPMKELQALRQAEQRRNAELEVALKNIVLSHPEMAGDPKSLAEHFDVLARFSPDVASTPVLAGNILSQLHKLGPGALTHQTVAELRKIQEGLDAERSGKVKQTIEAISPFTRLQT